MEMAVWVTGFSAVLNLIPVAFLTPYPVFAVDYRWWHGFDYSACHVLEAIWVFGSGLASAKANSLVFEVKGEGLASYVSNDQQVRWS